MENTTDASPSQTAITVMLNDLKDATLPVETLEAAFGPASLGILIVDGLPARFFELRLKLLSYGSYLANLPHEQLACLTLPSTKYLTGWSHGKEKLKTGIYDKMKGSYYVNCDFYQNAKHEACFKNARKEYSAETISNIWPPENTLPGFRGIFEELCWIIIDTAALVARACDRYALANIEGYEEGYLERVVRTSRTTKARLLHYFPSSEDAVSSDEERRLLDENPIEEDNWCATHIDHGCLTGLTSALYIDESAHPPVVPTDLKLPSLPILPALPSAPSPTTGLYIKSRTSKITRVDIPPLCLAFQTGEALQLITGGKFRAVPHFVRAGNNSNIARNTLAVFTQPNLEEIVDNKRGLTFADFSKEVNERFG